MLPTCGRCARRKNPELCVYHPAPLTKTTLPTPQSSLNEGSTSSPVAHSYECRPIGDTTLRFPPFEEPPVVPRVPRASSLPSQPWSSVIYGQQTIEELRRPLPSVEHERESIVPDGFVHHQSILAENEMRVGIMPSESESAATLEVTQAEIDRGATVLTLLKDLPLIQKYVDKWYSFARGLVIIEPMVRIWFAGVCSSWHKALEAQTTGGLRQMSEQIWKNTLISPCNILHRHTSPREFFTKTTGDNLRWEVVGILINTIALLSKTLKGKNVTVASRVQVMRYFLLICLVHTFPPHRYRTEN